jgi:hypothetical protein
MSEATRQTTPDRSTTFATAAIAALACSAAIAMTGDNIAAPFRGTWVPAHATCETPLKVIIDANAVTFVNGGQRAEFKKLEQCFSCMAHDVQDVTLLSTDQMGDSPWTITLDGRKKARPGVGVDMSNDKRFAARFPIGNGALKKCA